ncbi:MAG: hypothetical protein K2X87_30470 [Gemmataceae bacterium]|nr:hypothetical protein [Gemmataceae bacterium]
MTARLAAACTLAAGLAALPGCGPGALNVSRTYDLEPGEARSIDVDGIGSPQTLVVTYESSAGPVTVGVFKKADIPQDDDLMTVPATKSLAPAGKDDKGTVTAEVPANTPVRVVVRDPPKKSNVKVHVTNKK